MFANRFTALIDACSLVGVLGRNTLLSLAEVDLFRVRWSDQILSEAEAAMLQSPSYCVTAIGLHLRLPFSSPVLYHSLCEISDGTLTKQSLKNLLSSVRQVWQAFDLRVMPALTCLVLVACDGSNQIVTVSRDSLSVPVPKDIRQVAALSSNRLEIQVSINGVVERVLPVSGIDSVISTVVNIPADKNSEITIAWFAIVDSQRVILADFTDIVTVGTTVLDVGNYNDDDPEDPNKFDADGDGRNNLSEAIENRNLLSRFDMEVPLTDSFAASPKAFITNDGIDSEPSGDTTEVDEDSSFRLRHNGTELIVYVCGNDRTLFGDNSADGGDGRYWHDDTVFIYLDGGDSDNTEYDQLDDFQFAFVRGTAEVIRSKGPRGLCENADCLNYRFYRDSSECAYELDVALPLNELNLSIGAPIGFDIEITDDDNGGLREGASGWIGFDDRSDENPSTFGTIRLN